MAYRIEILRDLCIGAGTCVAEAPKVFDLDDEDVAVLVDPNGDADGDVLAAAEGCPTEAIVLRDSETGAQVFP